MEEDWKEGSLCFYKILQIIVKQVPLQDTPESSDVNVHPPILLEMENKRSQK